MRSRRPQLLASALALAVLVAGVIAFGLANPPRSGTPTVEIASLEQAVKVGLLDADVLAELRANGEARAIVHLDTEAIIAQIRRTLGEDRAVALIDAMAAAFRASKSTLLASLGPDVQLVEDFDRLGALVVTVRSEAAVLAALRSQLVRQVSGEREANLTEPSPRFPPGGSTTPGRPLFAPPSSFHGDGVAIGVLDTGVDNVAYPDYFPTGSIAGTLEAAPDDTKLDDFGHGSHVSSIVLLMAPGASLYVADVFTDVGPSPYGGRDVRAGATDVLEGMNWLLGLKQSGVNLRAVNLSLGSGHVPPDVCTDPYHLAEAWAAGIIPVASAGNFAFYKDFEHPTTDYQSGLGDPACNPSVLSVGAVTNGTCTDGSIDQVATFSQSSQALDLLAPGVCILAAGGYKDGTSMAAPHVAGAVAVMASAKPAATAYDIWASLIAVGPVVTDPHSGIARHRLDIPAAVDHLLATTGSQPTPNPGEVRGVALGVDSVSVDGSIAPGQAFDFEPFAVRNVGTVAADYKVTVEPPTDAFASTAPASWFTLSPSTVSLPAGDLGEVAMRVSPPVDASPAVYAAVVRVSDSGDASGQASAIVNVSFVVFDEDDDGAGNGGGTGGSGGSTGGSTGGSGVPDDIAALVDNPWVLLVGAVVVIWALRRLFGGSRRPTSTPPAG